MAKKKGKLRMQSGDIPENLGSMRSKCKFTLSLDGRIRGRIQGMKRNLIVP